MHLNLKLFLNFSNTETNLIFFVCTSCKLQVLIFSPSICGHKFIALCFFNISQLRGCSFWFQGCPIILNWIRLTTVVNDLSQQKLLCKKNKHCLWLVCGLGLMLIRTKQCTTIILFSVFGDMHLENDDYTLCVACLSPHDITVRTDCTYDALIT